MRWALTLLIGLLAAAPASAAPTRDVDLPALLAKQIARAKARTTVPILLPQKLPSDFKRHFPEGRSNAGGWRFDVGAVRGCHTATACFIAEFRGIAGAKPTGKRTVRLARGRTGSYHPSRCGASCAPPRIEWRERHSLYVVEAKVAGRKPLVRMANSAIRNGPR
jgi:hypothetical protein